MSNDSWKFFQAFLRAPHVVASIVPSSAFVERRVVRACNAAGASVVVELGGGTGGITRTLLRAMSPHARLLVIERTASFADALQKIDDRRLDVVHDCASAVGQELKRRDLGAADAIVSGIPFSTMPKADAERIIAAIYEALAPGGRFVAYQLSNRVSRYAKPLFGVPSVEYEFCNVPPLRLFTWQKAAQLP